MSDFSAFMMENADKVQNIEYVASGRFADESGPISWVLRCISSTEDEELRRLCTKRVSSPKNKGTYTSETDINLYMGKLAAAATVYPNLKDSALQDSYGVMGDDCLLKAMLTPGEYADYLVKVQEICGFDKSFGELVDEAKN